MINFFLSVSQRKGGNNEPKERTLFFIFFVVWVFKGTPDLEFRGFYLI